MNPLHLEIRNFFSHKESELDFTKFHSALIIGNIDGNLDYSNGSGKSAIFSAILWCLFNKSRAAAADDVISWGETQCKVSFVFSHFGQIYKVVRRRNRTYSTTSVEFLKLTDGEWIDISGSTSSLTNQEIEKTIKLDFKTFTNSIYFGQNDISEFADADPAKKKNILKSIIDLSKWDEYEDVSKSKLKELKLQSKILDSKLENYEQTVLDLASAKEIFADTEVKIEKLQSEKSIVSENLENVTKQYELLKQQLDTGLWDKTIEKIDALKKQLSTLISSESDFNSKIQKYKTTISKYSSEINDSKNQMSKIIFDDTIDEKVNKFNSELIDLKSKLSFAKDQITNAKKRVITDNQCYTCLQTITEQLKDKLTSELKADLDRYNSDSIYLANKILEVQGKINDSESVKKNNKLFLSLKDKISKTELELNIQNERYNEISEQYLRVSQDISRAKNEISLSNSVLESLTNNDFKNLKSQIKDSQSSLTVITGQLDVANQNIGKFKEKIKNLSEKISELDIVRLQLFKINNDIAIFDRLSKLLGKNGIQTILLNAVILDLEKTSNEILQSICNEEFVIYLDTQREGSAGGVVDTLDLRIKKDGVIQNFKSLSGGEQFRISLALRIGLSEISTKHGGTALEFLLLDEVNSPLDRHGTESLFMNVITSLEKRYKIIVITHNEYLKEKFSSIIEVTKVNGESTISYRND